LSTGGLLDAYVNASTLAQNVITTETSKGPVAIKAGVGFTGASFLKVNDWSGSTLLQATDSQQTGGPNVSFSGLQTLVDGVWDFGSSSLPWRSICANFFADETGGAPQGIFTAQDPTNYLTTFVCLNTMNDTASDALGIYTADSLSAMSVTKGFCSIYIGIDLITELTVLFGEGTGQFEVTTGIGNELILIDCVAMEVWVSLAGIGIRKIHAGAADSQGTGFRMLWVDN
jgi:hypothetical protein